MGTFWDFCAPFYDLVEKANGRAYRQALSIVRGLTPDGASVLEAAAGTGEISIAVADKAGRVLCTDLSGRMLSIARRKVKRRGIKNITFDKRSIYALNEPDKSFDIAIAGMVFHLLDAPEKAAEELKRTAKSMVIIPMVFTVGLRAASRLQIKFYRLLGFSPAVELSPEGCKDFLEGIGFKGCEVIPVAGKIPMAVAVWRAS